MIARCLSFVVIGRRLGAALPRWVRSNCLLFAFALYCQRSGCGNLRNVGCRRARNGLLPHFMYIERRRSGARLVHYVPRRGGDSESSPIFHGRVKWGDRDER